MAPTKMAEQRKAELQQQVEENESENLAATLSKLANQNETDEIDSTLVYDVEHLATFSTSSSAAAAAQPPREANGVHSSERSRESVDESVAANEPRVALQRLFELEKLSGIWTQQMQIKLSAEQMLIVDCETSAVVERFHRDCVTRPEAFNQNNNIYNNIVVFVIDNSQPPTCADGDSTSSSRREIDSRRRGHKQSSASAAAAAKRELRKFNLATNCTVSDCEVEEEETASESGEFSAAAANCNNRTAPDEVHIFQCVSHQAQHLVADILAWKSQQTGRPEDRQSSNEDALGQQDSNKTTAGDTGGRQQVLQGDASQRKQDQANKTDSDTTLSATNALEAAAERMRPTGGSQGVGDASRPAAACESRPNVTVASSAATIDNGKQIVNVNVKETVQIFNQIAALREKGKPNSPTNSAQPPRPLSDASASSSQAGQEAAASGNSLELGDRPQLYKQRSIRASLAPKLAAAGDTPTSSSASTVPATTTSSPATDQPASKLLLSSSSASSTSASEASRTGGGGGNGRRHTKPPSQAAVDKAAGAANGRQHYSQQQQLHGQSQLAGAQPLAKRSGQQKSASALQQRAQNGQANPTMPQQSHHHTQQPADGAESNCNDLSENPQLHQQDHLNQVSTNESYVSVLNHCFDDIEKFIVRLQHAFAATRELQARKKHAKRAASAAATNGALSPTVAPLSSAELALLGARARGPSEEDYFEILSKFKLAFNLLAKLKGCIHEPNAPELIHFLFTPLAIIIESARNVVPPIDPAQVRIPHLNKDALDLLSNCCTSKESDLWLSLGPNWTQTIDINLLEMSRLPSSFQPIFSDGWAPVISELELIGLAVPSSRFVKVNQMQSNGAGGDSSNIYAPPVAKQPAGAKATTAASRKQSAPSLIRGQMVEPASLEGEPAAQQQQVGRFNSGPHRSAKNYDDHVELGMIGGGGGYRVPNGRAHGKAANGRLPAPLKSRSRSYDQPAAYGIPNSHYAPPQPVGAPMMADERPLDLADYFAYPAGRDLNQSDGYTELHGSGNHYAASGGSAAGLGGYSLQRDEEQFLPPLGQTSSSRRHHQRDPARHRNGRKKSPKNLYLTEPTLLPYTAAQPADFNDEMAAEREAMLLDLGPAQTEWFYELLSRGAFIVRVLFNRDANNDKELSVRRGEVLEILDDTRKWWKARNIDQQVAYVPHTIIAVMEHYQTLDELLTNSGPTTLISDSTAVASSQRISRPDQLVNSYDHSYLDGEERRSSKVSGAFRYF